MAKPTGASDSERPSWAQFKLDTKYFVVHSFDTKTALILHLFLTQNLRS